MRHSNGKRPRGRSNRRSGGGGGSGPNSNRAYDSNGPSGKLRGTATQLVEKYTALAQDARAGRDRVLVENYFQHAEHYQRLVNELLVQQAAQQAAREEQPQVTVDNQGKDAQPQGQQQKAEQPKADQQNVAQAVAEAEKPANGATASVSPQKDEQPVVDVPVTVEAEVEAEVQPKPKPRRRKAAPKADKDAPETADKAPLPDA
ncbi:MAG: DUF4167 domain-containing protein [Alphaproteobacteria bacterium]